MWQNNLFSNFLIIIINYINITFSRSIFWSFFLPRLISIFLQISINFEGDKFDEISKIIFKNFGLFGFGQDKLSYILDDLNILISF